MNFKEWEGFNFTDEWTEDIDVRDFIQSNYTPYYGDGDFLSSITEKTDMLWEKTAEGY